MSAENFFVPRRQAPAPRSRRDGSPWVNPRDREAHVVRKPTLSGWPGLPHAFLPDGGHEKHTLDLLIASEFDFYIRQRVHVVGNSNVPASRNNNEIDPFILLPDFLRDLQSEVPPLESPVQKFLNVLPQLLNVHRSSDLVHIPASLNAWKTSPIKRIARLASTFVDERDGL